MTLRRHLGALALVVVFAGAAGLATAVAREPAGAALPRCAVRQLAYAAHVEGIAGALVPTIDIWNVSGRKCRLDRRVTLRVTAPSGRLLDVQGNPRRHTFDRRLSPDHAVFAGFGWRNWCDQGGRVAYRFTIGHRTLILRAGARPACNAPSSPSTLRFEGSGGRA